MFFLGRNISKHFKKRDNLSGQIFPFLLICIAALLVAALISGRSGRGAVNKTCVSNGADACSLATGSSSAGAFNALVKTNKEMEDYYMMYLGFYTVLNTLADSYLEEGILNIDLARSFAKLAKEKMEVSQPDCQAWNNQVGAFVANASYDSSGKLIWGQSAAWAAFESAKCFAASGFLSVYMQFLTDNFKVNQLNYYCDGVRTFIDKSFEQAKTTGYSYAFSNSCTSSKAPDGDAFNLWLGTNAYKDPSPDKEVPGEATYKWPGYSEKCGASECGATVTLDLPKVVSYKLRHTKLKYPVEKDVGLRFEEFSCIPMLTEEGRKSLGGLTILVTDPFNNMAAEFLRDAMDTISVALQENETTGKAIYEESYELAECCKQPDTCVDNPNPPPDQICTPPVCDYTSLRKDAADLYNKQVCIWNGLEELNKPKTGIISGKTLLALNQDIFNDVWQEDQGDLFKSEDKTCDDVWGYGKSKGEADVDSIKKGLMIVAIGDEPEFFGPPNPWQAKCTVTSFCNNIHYKYKDTCINTAYTSSSTSEFHGEGELKSLKDNYEARIIEAN